MTMKKITIEFDDDFKTHYEGMDNALEVLGMLRFAESQIIESINASFEIDKEGRTPC
jgi:hypothetical protein